MLTRKLWDFCTSIENRKLTNSGFMVYKIEIIILFMVNKCEKSIFLLIIILEKTILFA